MFDLDAKQAWAIAIKAQADDFSVTKVRFAFEPFYEIATAWNLGERCAEFMSRLRLFLKIVH